MFRPGQFHKSTMECLWSGSGPFRQAPSSNPRSSYSGIVLLNNTKANFSIFHSAQPISLVSMHVRTMLYHTQKKTLYHALPLVIYRTKMQYHFIGALHNSQNSIFTAALQSASKGAQSILSAFGISQRGSTWAWERGRRRRQGRQGSLIVEGRDWRRGEDNKVNEINPSHLS